MTMPDPSPTQRVDSTNRNKVNQIEWLHHGDERNRTKKAPSSGQPYPARAFLYRMENGYLPQPELQARTLIAPSLTVMSRHLAF